MRTLIIEVVLWDDDDRKAEALIAKVDHDPRVLSAVEISR